ncbi:MAG: cyclic nucleotide-binding domain-containing protein [Nitrospinae bacterium]|nr:cyclic nucleotide-binding domain-containing protein [Nitrospinota bacterium]
MKNQKWVKKGSAIVNEGNFSDSAFIVDKGKFEIAIGSKDPENAGQVLCTLRRNEIFGELGLIDGLPRSATVTALEDSQISVLSKEDFLSLATHNPKTLLPLLKILTQRLRDTLKKLKSVPQIPQPQTFH